jgi:hypothetical protein
MQRFLNGYPDDGTCLEGFSYWRYGFGHFVWFADMVKEFTKGQVDLFVGQKVKNMAGYPQRSFLCGPDTIISFSDGARTGKIDCALQHYLHKIYPDEIICFDSEKMYPCGMNLPFVHYLRTFLHYDPNAPTKDMVYKDYYLEAAQQVIINRGGYSLAIKAGHNQEQHNHNDVGHFIFSDKDGQAFCDIGAGRYTKEYHKTPERYTYFCTGSQGHSVPMFDGITQMYGLEHFGKMQFDGKKVVIDFEKAYEIKDLKECRRVVEIMENGVVLTDSFDYQGEITERFVSLREPVIKDGFVAIGATSLLYDKKYTPCVTVVKQQPSNRFIKDDYNVYCIDFCGVDKQFSVTITAQN